MRYAVSRVAPLLSPLSSGLENIYKWWYEDRLNCLNRQLRFLHCLRPLLTITPDHYTDPAAVYEDA